MELGQYFTTNKRIKNSITRLTKKYVRKNKKIIDVLEPSFGQGDLIDNLCKTMKKIKLDIDGYEIDDTIPYIFKHSKKIKLKKNTVIFLKKSIRRNMILL